MIPEILAKLSAVVFIAIGYTITFVLAIDLAKSKIIKKAPKIIVISVIVCILLIAPLWIIDRTFS